jgi:hypothetical protein
MSSRRPGGGVNVAVVVAGVMEGVSDSVIIKGRPVVVGVADGINRGVGDKIAGEIDGVINGVITVIGM